MAHDCFILGAGASRVSKAPLVADFQEKAKATLEKLPTEPQDIRDRHEYALDAWRHLAPHADIEEFYVLIDLKTRILGGPDTTLGMIEGIVQEMIANTLRYSITDEGMPVHDSFVRILDGYQKQGNKSTVISLNWDLTLDSALHRAGLLHYGSSLVVPPVGTGSGLDHLSRNEVGKILLLKPHGSLNWIYCPTCNAFQYSPPPEKVVVNHWSQSGLSCPEHGRGMDENICTPGFVPPLSQKLGSHKSESPLASIWQKTTGRLRSATKVTFLGYSLPPNDLQFRMMLLDSFNRNEDLNTISIVAPFGHGQKRVEYEQRFSPLLSQISPDVEVEFHNMTYHQWVSKHLN